MIRLRTLILLTVLFMPPLLPAMQPRKSPHETIYQKLEENRDLVMIIYGRPYTNDPTTGKPRVVWGGNNLVPTNKIWRLGADEATLLIVQRPVRIAETVVPAGAYSLWFLLGSDNSGTLIINRDFGQWGLEPPRQDRDLARIPLTRSKLSPPIHQFTMALDKTPDGKGVLRLMWEDRQYSVQYTDEK